MGKPGDVALVNFNAGEFSPRLWSRLDMDKAGSACRTMENMIASTYGGARRRPGTRFLAESGSPVAVPTGPEGITVFVNRTTTASGDPIPTDPGCMKIITSFDLTYLSIIGTGCLCGYEEFDDGGGPTFPPKRYRKKTFSTGFIQWQYDNAGCVCAYGSERLDIDGFNEYDSLSCVKTVGATAHRVFKTDCVTVSLDTNIAIDSFNDAAWGNADFSKCTTVDSKTVRSISPNRGDCAGPVSCVECHSPPPTYCTVFGDTLHETLSDEDKPYDAILRGAHAAAGGYVTSVASFDGAYCYTNLTAVRFTMDIRALLVDCDYKVTVTHSVNVGGTVTIITDEIVFTAESENETLHFDVPVNPDGTVTPTIVKLEVV